MIEIDASQRQRLDAIRNKYRIRLLIAFGSRISGLARQDSDLDIGIFYDEQHKPLDVATELQKVFPRYEIDIANLNRADPLLLEQVNKGCTLL
jgi:predicted nucleotidyltransferase